MPGFFGKEHRKLIGSALIDRRMVKAAVINQEIWRVTYWTDDDIVMCLCSADMVFKILYLKNGTQDPVTIAITCLHFYFMLVYLVAVNYKGIIKAKECVSMIWHCLLWVLYIDRVCTTTE